MEITFSDAETRDLCCCRESLVRVYGLELGRKICSRLSLLNAVASLSELPTTPPIGFAAVDGTGVHSVALGDNHRLYFKAVTQDERQGSTVAYAEIQIIGPVPNPPAKGRKA